MVTTSPTTVIRLTGSNLSQLRRVTFSRYSTPGKATTRAAPFSEDLRSAADLEPPCRCRPTPPPLCGPQVPASRQPGQIAERVPVPDRDPASRQVHSREARRLVHLLHFPGVWMQLAVRQRHTGRVLSADSCGGSQGGGGSTVPSPQGLDPRGHEHRREGEDGRSGSVHSSTSWHGSVPSPRVRPGPQRMGPPPPFGALIPAPHHIGRLPHDTVTAVYARAPVPAVRRPPSLVRQPSSPSSTASRPESRGS